MPGFRLCSTSGWITVRAFWIHSTAPSLRLQDRIRPVLIYPGQSIRSILAWSVTGPPGRRPDTVRHRLPGPGPGPAWGLGTAGRALGTRWAPIRAWGSGSPGGLRAWDPAWVSVPGLGRAGQSPIAWGFRDLTGAILGPSSGLAGLPPASLGSTGRAGPGSAPGSAPGVRAHSPGPPVTSRPLPGFQPCHALPSRLAASSQAQRLPAL